MKSLIKNIGKSILPEIWRIKLRRAKDYAEAIKYHVLFNEDTCCTANTLRCLSNKKSKGYCHDVLGRNIPVCCASHLVELLFWTDNVFRKNNLSYMIAYGTLLGAVRHHGGIIPWDTDADCYIDKGDVDRIYKILLEEKRASHVPYHIKMENHEIYGDVIKICFSETNLLHVDLFSYVLDADSGVVDFCVCKVLTKEVFPLREIEFYGRKVYAPKTNAFLNIYYGKDWDKYYFPKWGLFTQKRLLTDDKRKPAVIDENLIKEKY